MNNIENQFQQLVARPKSDDLLIVYYTGHGGDGLFETYDGESWMMKWIGKTIDRDFKGSKVLLIGDCCNSGSLEDIVKAKHGGIAYAAISSSARDEEGHGNWTCSQAVLDGLTGDPSVDTNHDGKVSLRELGEHVQKEILTYENNHSVFALSNGFDTQMIVATTAALTGPDPEPVRVLYHGKWWKARLLARSGNQGHIRWIQLGYDSPDQDEWIDLRNIRPISEN